ncbi:MAG: type II toxin-antitoxin system RelE/ParE family toxin [Thermodesulfovibrionales bacterium]|nr:type II toxin-antitoxin system RelE/ParE family toxin [Thermodesulfovibrionales bacterium]MDP3111485.1 type II toxin-antitoxin system RelE/ParE family toxin [Thermodesulfovibrionales bacterium]
MVKWSTPAKFDLKQIHDYIARDSKFYAQKVSTEIVEKSEKLNSFPEIGRIVPEIGNPNIRELLIYSYRLVYEIFPDKVEVLALIHGKRNFVKDFLNKQTP